MSTETRPEAELAEVIDAALANGPQGFFPHGLGVPYVARDAALSWMTARLTDDDVVEAAAKAISRAIWGSDTAKDEWTQEARAALAAAAALIGGEGR